jgi:hypothetical protein
MKIEFMVLWVGCRVVWWMNTNVSEDRSASIFRVEVHSDGVVSVVLYLRPHLFSPKIPDRFRWQLLLSSSNRKICRGWVILVRAGVFIKVKAKLPLCLTITPRRRILYLTKHHALTYGVGVEVYLQGFLTSTLHWDERSASLSGPFTPGERSPGTHWIEGLLGLWVGMKETRKSPSLRWIQLMFY